MTSVVEICNLALENIGADTITSLTEGTRNANVCNNLYEKYRDYLLRKYHWKFATKRIKLAKSSNSPVFEFDNQFPVPSDFIRIVEVSDNTDGTGSLRYKLEYDATDTRVIASSSEDVYLRYVARITDAQTFDEDFVMALAFYMAMTLAIKIAESNTLRASMKEEYKETIRQARSNAAMEDYPEQLPEGSWSESRYSDYSDYNSWG